MARGRTRMLQLAALTPLVVLAGWIAVRALRPAPPAPKAPRPEAVGELPPAQAVGALRREPGETFAGDAVYAYLDGGAEVYLRRGLQRIRVASYFFSTGSSGELEVEAASMEFATAGGARDQAAELVPAGGRPVDGLPGAVATGQELVMQRGRRLLRLVAFSPDLDAGPELAAIAAAWVALHPEDGGG